MFRKNFTWVVFLISLNLALNMTPSIDCYRVGAIPNIKPHSVRRLKQVQVTRGERVASLSGSCEL